MLQWCALTSMLTVAPVPICARALLHSRLVAASSLAHEIALEMQCAQLKNISLPDVRDY